MNRRQFVSAAGLFLAAPVCNGQQQTAFTQLRRAFKVDQVSFEAALKQLAASTRPKVLFGLELYTDSTERTNKLLSVDMQNASVEMIVQELCQQQGGYTPIYDAQTQVVNILPVNAPRDYTGLQNLLMKPQLLRGNAWPENLFQHFADSCPEIYEYKETRFREQHQRLSGSFQADAPGSILPTHVTPPPYSVQLSGLRLRDQLNELAAYTRVQPPVRTLNTSSGVIYLYSYGWKFTIHPYAQAQNGLGGYPFWRSFPL